MVVTLAPVAEPIAVITQADLQALEAQNDTRVEVFRGEIVETERGMPLIHGLIIQFLYDLLKEYLKTHSFGKVYIDGFRYILQGDFQAIRDAAVPDLSYIRDGRLSADLDWDENDFPIAPDLAVEVLSPGQSQAKLLAKISDYLQAGTQEAWLIYPKSRKLLQYFRDGEDGPQHYTAQDTLTSPLFPELQISLADMFRKPKL